MTPLGSLVEPEVYWRKATVSSWISGAVQSGFSPNSVASVATHGRSSSPDCWTASVTDSRWPESVSTSRTWALVAMAAVREPRLPLLSGTGAGTAMTPAYRQPTKARTKSSPLG
ncbi:hypothetical protein GCM10020000_12730 [Streptomyces olivoverticillatus]